ncbi:MAG: acyl-CoA dehydrogenase family protein [Thermodesulfobacteriota bacterium]|nr:acyl-CoA dehydrogenase family protein [Thermodesulfobacteriota bacterium]
MIKRSEVKEWMAHEPAFDDIMCSLRSAPRIPRTMISETRKVVAMARKFNNEVVRPYTLELDRTIQQDPEFLPWEFVKQANQRGFYSLVIPKIVGGKGYNFPAMSHFLEEVGTECLAMSNLIGVHYLGATTLLATWNMKLINEIIRQTAEGEKTNDPSLITLAITEPAAGTDVEEVSLLDKANITFNARREQGGYVLNGTKVFISNGHLSKWHVVIGYEDQSRPSETMLVVVVKTGTKGFSFGRKERKMGQKGCPASELIFKECFVPDEHVVFDSRHSAKLKRPPRETGRQIIEYVVSVSRAAVGAWGVGAARGALENAMQFAMETHVDGKLLINHEWVQCRLAEMYKTMALARLAYMENNYANGLDGAFKILQLKPLYYLMKILPASMIDKFITPTLGLPFTTWLFRKLQMDWQKDEQIHRTTGWGSLAKVSGTDAGIRNCQMALEIMGQAGLRHDRRVEKILRDSKLLQIYEGTNQLNRLNIFESFLASHHSRIKVYEHE